MNERLMELGVLAGLIAEEHNGFDRTCLTRGEKRFAELIIQECIRCIKARKSIAVDDEWNVDEAMTAAEDDIMMCFEV